MTTQNDSYVLVLDEGTTSTRAVLFDGSSAVVENVGEPLDIASQPSGETEQDANEIWTKSRDALRTVVERASAAGRRVSVLAMAAQRTTTVVWDRLTGEPVSPVFSWQDTRCTELVDEMRDAWGERVTQTTGLSFGAANVPLHLSWILRNDPELRRRAEAGEILGGTPDTWLIWKLTGGPDGGTFVTSTSCAGSSGGMDIHKDAWWEEFLSELDVPVAMLPQILPEDGDFGTTRADIIGIELPITGILGDQQSALYGQGGFAPGSVKCTHGTGSFLDFNIGSSPVIPGGGIDCRVAWKSGPKTAYVMEGGSFVTGSGVDWLVDGIGVLEKASVIDATYAAADPASGLICVPALAGFAAPYWDGAARGLLIGLNRGTTKADIVRATLDGIAHTIADLLGAMSSASGVSPQMVAVDGGLGRSDALLQAQADLMDAAVMRAAQSEFITARGAAWLAGVAAGVWATPEEADATKEVGKVFEPRMKDAERTVRREAWQDAVDRALGWRRAVLPTA
jgi:glycerol kinase